MADMQQAANAAAQSKHAVDYALGATGVSSPVWYHWLNGLNEFVASVALIGGAVLVVLRIALAIRELRRG